MKFISASTYDGFAKQIRVDDLTAYAVINPDPPEIRLDFENRKSIEIRFITQDAMIGFIARLGTLE